MVPKGRRRPIHHYDRFYCTVGDWRREYEFGAIIPERKYDESGHKERDHITITTKVRHHTTSRAKSSRKFEAMEIILSPDHTLREKWSKDAERIGMIFFDRESFRAHVDLASDVYFSLIPCLAANHFKEITLSVRNLRYCAEISSGSGFSLKKPLRRNYRGGAGWREYVGPLSMPPGGQVSPGDPPLAFLPEANSLDVSVSTLKRYLKRFPDFPAYR